MTEFLYCPVNQEIIAQTSKMIISGALKYDKNFKIQFIFFAFCTSLYPYIFILFSASFVDNHHAVA
jgi:hypothetical protein